MELVKCDFSLRDYNRFDSEKRKVYLFEEQNCDILLNDFYTRLLNVIKNRQHFPVVRLADGEYQFLLGKNEFNLRKPTKVLLRNLIGELVRKIFKQKFEARSKTYTSGVYDTSELGHVKSKYSKCLKHVSANGVLALYTVIKPDFYTEHYLPKLWNFFEEQSIKLNSKNYIPFYFIYIILTNKKYSEIYQDRHVHLITSFDEFRKLKINKSLISLGVKRITWTKLSRDKSLFDTLDVDAIPSDVDIIFVGAGVGKVNIFNQLCSLSVPIIDAGYIFETWQEPHLAHERDYCLPHEEFVSSHYKPDL